MLRLSRKKNIILASSGIVTAVMLSIVLWANYLIAECAGAVMDDVGQVPPQRVGLVLGCSKTANGRPNRFYHNRIKACHELFANGTISKILVSGDNSRRDYDEPSDMKADLMSLGIPAADIVCDYAGFSTLDSVIRARKVFGIQQCVVISQRFHCERAVYIARHNDLDLIGYAAADVDGAVAARVYLREYLARAKAWLDINLFGRQPKFLGPTCTV